MSQSAALFGKPQPQAKHLLQFKAGKMTQDPENWVQADPRKGWVYVYQAGDGKLHFCWIDRKTCLVEENFVISPKQAEFKRVAECKTGRVFLLKFKGSKRFFIWMQEPTVKNDNDICTRVNHLIKSPPAPANVPSTDWTGELGKLNQLSHSDLLTLLSMGVGLGSGLSSESDVSSAQATEVTTARHLNTSRLETPLVSGPTVPAVTNTTASSGGSTTQATGKHPEGAKFQLQDLQNILSSIPVPPKAPSIDANDVISVDSLRDLLSRSDVQSRLLPHLPASDPESESIPDVDRLTTNVRSSQFKSTLKSFFSAFQTGDLAPLLSQFNLGAAADQAAKTGDLVSFSKALQDNNKPSSAEPAVVTTVEPSFNAAASSNPSAPTTTTQDPESVKKDKPPNSETAMDTDE